VPWITVRSTRCFANARGEWTTPSNPQSSREMKNLSFVPLSKCR
jgi:hypothetical protein